MNKQEFINILVLAKENKLPEILNSKSGINLESVKNLVLDGYLTGEDISSLGEPIMYIDTKITLLGIEYLEANITKNYWYHNFSNRIAVYGLIVAILGLWLGLK